MNQEVHPRQESLPLSSTVEEFSQRHSLGVATTWRMIRDGQLEAVKIRRATRIPLISEQRWLNSLKRR